MGFQVRSSADGAKPLREFAGEEELNFLQSLSPNFFNGDVLEIGCRSGLLAELLLTTQPNLSSYTGTGQVLGSRVDLGPKFRFQSAAPGEMFGLPPAAFDRIITFYLLEQLKMDHLYMILSEARRLIKPDGLWVIQAHVPGFKKREKFLSSFWRARGMPLIELDHFLSPEDWAVIGDEQRQSWGLISRQLVLRRLPE